MFKSIASPSPARPLIDGLLLVLATISVLGFTGFAAALDEVGFPLDDAWIHQTYARNLAEHGEWSFTPGQPSTASTAPLYSLLLSIGHLIGLSPFAWAHFLGILALFGAAVISIRLAERLFPDIPWVGPGTGLLVVLSWHLVWAAASGMETMLFMTLSLTVIMISWREMEAPEQSPLWRGGVLGLMGGLLYLTRPEGIGLVGLAGLFVLVSGIHNRRTFGLWAAGVAAGFLLIILPYILYNYSQSDELLPSTADAKIAEYASLRDDFILTRYFNMILPVLVGAQFVWLPGIIVGLIAVARRVSRRNLLYLLPPSWAFAHLTLFVLVLPAPYQHGRYAMPILPPLLLFAVGGMGLILMASRNTAAGRVSTRTLALSAVLIVPGFWWLGGRAYGTDVQIINTEMVKIAQWIADYPDIVPPDELLAVHDIGAVGYYAQREIFDLAGLVSPEVVPVIRDGEALMQLMCENDVKWLMVLPEQQPTDDDDPRLELVYSTEEPHIIEAGGEGNMKVFRLHFDADCTPP